MTDTRHPVPTDAELDELRQANGGKLNFVTFSEFRTIARAVLAKWGSQPVACEPLTDEQIDAVAESMPGGLAGFLKGWGWRQFAREILTLRRMPDWEPQFDCMTPKQEELAIQFCQEIAGPRGERGSPPDPVRLLEMAEALYKAERERHHGIKGGQHGAE